MGMYICMDCYGIVTMQKSQMNEVENKGVHMVRTLDQHGLHNPNYRNVYMVRTLDQHGLPNSNYRNRTELVFFSTLG